MSKILVVGRFGGAHGIRGWLKITSFTDPIDNILNFNSWLVKLGSDWLPIQVEKKQVVGKRILVKINDLDTPEAGQKYHNCEIGIDKSQLPKLVTGEYYWADLEGSRVVTQAGIELGVIKSIMATGSNDVLVVVGERERLIPYLSHVVVDVDLTQGVVTVDWDDQF